MTSSAETTFAPSPLGQGERIVWPEGLSLESALTRHGRRLATKRERRAMRWIYGATMLAAYASVLFNLRRVDSDTIIKAVCGGIILAAIVLVAMRWVFPKSSAQSGHDPRRRSFNHLLITDRRVLLFDHLDKSARTLSLESITDIARDYAEGSPALVIRTFEAPEGYAVLGETDVAGVQDAVASSALADPAR